MTHQPMPTNMDDAFTEGWYFGRYCRSDNHHEMTCHNTVEVRREYERGVFEGHQFQENVGRAA